MINDRKSNWLPTIDQFLVSWDMVNVARKPGPELVLADNYGRGDLLSDHQALLAQLETETRLTVQLAEEVAQRESLHTELLDLVRSYNRYHVALPKEVRVWLPFERTPSKNSGVGAVIRCVENIQATWGTYAKHREGTPEYRPPVLTGGRTMADFQGLLDNIKAVIGSIATRRLKLSYIQVEVRLLAINSIYPRLIAYRRMVTYLYPVNHSLVVSLPRLQATNSARRPVVEG